MRASAKSLARYNGSWYAQGTQRGGVSRITYGWMKPGSFTRRQFEKQRNPFVDLDAGQSIYYRDMRQPMETAAREADAMGIKGMDNAVDLYNEHRIVPDLYPEGFQWKHKLNTEYNQWRSSTWLTPDLIPIEHRGRFLCNFQLNVGEYSMKVAKFSPSDHRQWIYCVLYIGSGKGLAGFGRAVGPSPAEAKKEAIREAFKNMQGMDLEQGGPMYPVRLNVDGCRIVMFPAKKISGNNIAADIICAFGMSGCGVHFNTRAITKPKSFTKRAQAVFEAVRLTRSVSEIAQARGKIPHSLLYNIYPYLEEMRRRKGMFAMHPKGKDGVFSPDRVVDNRMPDHLKKGYYDDVYWKDFFAGNPAQLSEPKMGLRADQLRALVPAKTGGAPGGRRTLADFLARANKTSKDLGSIPITNANWDAKLPTHMRANYQLH